jgi:hypothetical protein
MIHIDKRTDVEGLALSDGATLAPVPPVPPPITVGTGVDGAPTTIGAAVPDPSDDGLNDGNCDPVPPVPPVPGIPITVGAGVVGTPTIVGAAVPVPGDNGLPVGLDEGVDDGDRDPPPPPPVPGTPVTAPDGAELDVGVRVVELLATTGAAVPVPTDDGLWLSEGAILGDSDPVPPVPGMPASVIVGAALVVGAPETLGAELTLSVNALGAWLVVGAELSVIVLGAWLVVGAELSPSVDGAWLVVGAAETLGAVLPIVAFVGPNDPTAADGLALVVGAALGT